MDTTNRTLTIGIDYSQISKSVMARIAMAVAGRQAETALPFTRCRLQELAAINAQTACKEICSTLAGYVTDYTIDNETATIDLALPATMPTAPYRTLALRIEDAITARVVTGFLASSPDFTAEAHQAQAEAGKCLSSLRQLLCAATITTSQQP